MKKVNIVKGTNIVYVFEDGSKAVQLLTKNAVKVEEDRIHTTFIKDKQGNPADGSRIVSIRNKRGETILDIQLHNFFKHSGWHEFDKNGQNLKYKDENWMITKEFKYYSEFIDNLYVKKTIDNLR
ncbi:MAG: hypothetical protein IJ638_04280 [Alphaproteobacteria bacterium]|nr:hypothetical protein [Alphaproteobacteria bacterium]